MRCIILLIVVVLGTAVQALVVPNTTRVFTAAELASDCEADPDCRRYLFGGAAVDEGVFAGLLVMYPTPLDAFANASDSDVRLQTLLLRLASAEGRRCAAGEDPVVHGSGQISCRCRPGALCLRLDNHPIALIVFVSMILVLVMYVVQEMRRVHPAKQSD